MQPPKLVNMIEKLIATPSISSVSEHWDQSNQAVIEQLYSWFSDLGFRTEILPIPARKGKFNLIASAGSGSEGLILSGHSDTVPFDEQHWQSNPFQLVERDQRLFGLGTADMKSFFAIVIEAIRELPITQLKQPLTIIATADEESSMCGARYLSDLGRRLGRHAVIGEPTGLRPIRTHKGITMEALRLTGQSGHSSNPALGNSALEGMHQLIGELLRWRTELQQKHHNPMFEVAIPTVNLGRIHGGDNPNRICAHCELHIDIRPLPGMPLEALRQQLWQRLHPVSIACGLTLVMEQLFEGVPAMETPAQAEIVRVVEDLTGHRAGAVAFATEGPFFNELGLETLIIGPGSIDQAHQPDEYLALDQIKPAINLIRDLIRRFCL